MRSRLISVELNSWRLHCLLYLGWNMKNVKQNIGLQKFGAKMLLIPKQILGPKKFWSQKNQVSKGGFKCTKFWSKYFGHKDFGDKIKAGQKLLVKKFVSKKKFWSKRKQLFPWQMLPGLKWPRPLWPEKYFPRNLPFIQIMSLILV